MHDHYIRSIDTQLTNEEVIFLWLSRTDLKAETKSEIMAAQDHALQTQYHAKNITNRNRQQMQTMSKILQENRTHYISMPITVKYQYNEILGTSEINLL